MIVALIEFGLCDAKQLISSHLDLLDKYLKSNIKREVKPVIDDVLDSLQLSKKVYIRTIRDPDDSDDFYLTFDSYGTKGGVEIFVVHLKEHFFLAKPFCPANVDKNPFPTLVKKSSSYTGLNGVPDFDFEMEDFIDDHDNESEFQPGDLWCPY